MAPSVGRSRWPPQELTYPGAAAVAARWPKPGALPAVGAGWALLFAMAAVLLKLEAGAAAHWPASVETPAPVRGGPAGPVPERLCFTGVDGLLRGWAGAPRRGACSLGPQSLRAHARADALPYAARALLPPPADILGSRRRILQRAALLRGPRRLLAQGRDSLLRRAAVNNDHCKPRVPSLRRASSHSRGAAPQPLRPIARRAIAVRPAGSQVCEPPAYHRGRSSPPRPAAGIVRSRGRWSGLARGAS